MKMYKSIVVVSIVLLICSITVLILSSVRTPKLEEQKDTKYAAMNENVEDLRYDNVVWPTQSGVDALNNIGVNVDFAEQELSRNSYVEIPHSVVIVYGNERYFINMDDFTKVIYSTTNFGSVDHYIRYYFTEGDSRITSTSFEVVVDPSIEFDYWHSESDIDEYRLEYISKNISHLQNELDFYEIGNEFGLFFIIITIPLIIFYVRKLVLYSGFETVDLAKEHYRKLNDLKSRKKEKDTKQKVEDRQIKRLKELEELEKELEGN